jgi:hypothetical protein
MAEEEEVTAADLRQIRFLQRNFGTIYRYRDVPVGLIFQDIAVHAGFYEGDLVQRELRNFVQPFMERIFGTSPVRRSFFRLEARPGPSYRFYLELLRYIQRDIEYGGRDDLQDMINTRISEGVLYGQRGRDFVAYLRRAQETNEPGFANWFGEAIFSDGATFANDRQNRAANAQFQLDQMEAKVPEAVSSNYSGPTNHSLQVDDGDLIYPLAQPITPPPSPRIGAVVGELLPGFDYSDEGKGGEG